MATNAEAQSSDKQASFASNALPQETFEDKIVMKKSEKHSDDILTSFMNLKSDGILCAAQLASDGLPVPCNLSVDESSETKLSQPMEESVQVVSKSSKDHAHDMLSSHKKLQCDGDFCDITIICGDFQMKAHRHVLASATEYFKGMFLNETREAKIGIVDFSTMSPEVVKQCMEFIYSRTVDISMLIARDLLGASELMQLPKLSTLCVEFLAENVYMECRLA